MESLRAFAQSTGITVQSLPSGKSVRIPTWTVRFPSAVPPRLPTGVLKRTYTIKPVVCVDGESVFGELGIVRWLAKDGWDALWVDTFHGRKFWHDMPHIGEPVNPPARIRALYSRIAQLKGGPSGCFDVVGWKDDRIAWFEYKGRGDKANANELLWIDAAIQAGVRENDLVCVGSAPRAGTTPDVSSAEPVNDFETPGVLSLLNNVL